MHSFQYSNDWFNSGKVTCSNAGAVTYPRRLADRRLLVRRRVLSCSCAVCGQAAPALAVSGEELWTVAWDAEVRPADGGLALRERSPAQRQLADAALTLALDLGMTVSHRSGTSLR